MVGLNTNLYSIAVDSSSSLEFGAASSAADGALTIDGGQTVGFGTNGPFSSNGTIAAKLVVNGVLNETYGTGVIEGFGGAVGSISGTGTIDLSNDGGLIRDAADSTAIVFSTLGPAILELEGPLPTGTISGFAPSNPVESSSSNGNAIQVDQTVTGVSFKQTTGTLGTLTLTDGATTVGTLLFSGNYTSSLFHLDSDATSGSATITLQTASGAAGTAKPQREQRHLPGPAPAVEPGPQRPTGRTLPRLPPRKRYLAAVMPSPSSVPYWPASTRPSAGTARRQASRSATT